MRVLHLLNDVTDRGNGIVNTALDLAMEQAHQGLDVAVASAGGAYQGLLQRSGVAHFTVNQSLGPIKLVASARALGTCIRSFQPDIVHAHMRSGLLLAWICRRFQRFALVSHVHNVHDRESLLMGLADRVIAVSQSVAATMATQGIPARKIRVVLNRTLGSRRVPPAAEVVPAALLHPAIVTVGGMNHRKGIQELIAVFDSIATGFPSAHLYLVGDGPDRSEFEAQARASQSASRIHFEGYQAQPQSYMQSADIFVLASRRESFGLVLIEAREVGCAIVATDVDGVAEALDGGSAGLLVPPADKRALASSMHRLLTGSEERAIWKQKSRMGVDRFHVSRMVEETAVVYQDVLSQSDYVKSSAAHRFAAAPRELRNGSPAPVDDRESQAARS